MTGREILEFWRSMREHPEPVTGLPYGVGLLDSTLRGLNAGDMVVLASLPGAGKSILVGMFALSFARHLRERGISRQVKIFTLEMSADMYKKRLVAACSEVPLDRLETGQCTDDEFARACLAMEEVDALPLKIVDEAACSRLGSILMEIGPNKNTAAWIIDHVGLVTGGAGELYTQHAHIAERLRVYARDCAPGIVVTHVRHGMSEEFQLQDLRYSSMYANNATVVLGLSRPDLLKDDPVATTEVPAALVIRKNRNGPTGKIPLVWNRRLALFRPAETDDRQFDVTVHITPDLHIGAHEYDRPAFG